MEATYVPIDSRMGKEDVHICNGNLFRHKKECNHAICSNMDATRHYHAECSKAEKNEYRVMSFICGIKEMIRVNLCTEQKQPHRLQEQTSQSGEGDTLGVWG